MKRQYLSGAAIRRRREKLGWSQVELARLAGCSHTTIQYYEKHDPAPKSRVLRDVIDALVQGEKMKALHSSEKHNWCTPPNVLRPVREVFCGRIGLDPCGSVDACTDALMTLFWPFEPPATYGGQYRHRDGLAASWSGYGGVFVNPPYGTALGDWSEKAVLSQSVHSPIIFLSPARTDTRWFRALALSASRIAFWHGRITFLGAPSTASFPSALFLLGGGALHASRFTSAFRAHALVFGP